MPRKPVELTDSAKKRLKDIKNPRSMGSGAAAKAGKAVANRKSSNRSALNAAKKAFNNARRP